MPRNGNRPGEGAADSVGKTSRATEFTRHPNPTQASSIIRFPPRRSAAVWLMRAREGGWLVLARGHGWLHGDRNSAIADAQWLAENYGLPIRNIASNGAAS